MINHKYKSLYNQDSVSKEMIIAFDGGEITNADLYSESFELKESLCSESELRFGSCEASVIKFKITNTVESLKNKVLTVSEILNGLQDEPFQFGVYKVDSDVPSGDRNYRNITAYDRMYDVINAEMVEWYDNLTFPITMRDFRNSFFEYLGIEQVETTLVNDDMLIEKTIDADSISGKTIITAICELNGAFGHINRQGLFDYISLEKRKQMIYPGMNGVYPGSGIYPGMMVDIDYAKEDINTYISCEYEDFETQLISKLQIRQEENDIGAIYGTGTNTYIVQDNFLVYGKSADELSTIARKLFSKINGVYYRPFKASLQGNPCIEVGDNVVFHTKYKEVEGYVLERTIKGIQALKDVFESKGVYEYEEKVNSVQKEVKKLKGKTNKLERTVEKLESTITDEENGLQTKIQQTAEKVEVMAGDEYVSSKISVELGKILLKGNRIAIESDYFTLTEDGKIEATSALIKGALQAFSASFGVIINNGMIQLFGSSETGPIGIISPMGFESTGEFKTLGIALKTISDNLQFFVEDKEISNSYHYLYQMNNIDYVNQNVEFAHVWRGSELHSGKMSTEEIDIFGTTSVYSNFSVTGTKSRLAKTKSYNDRLLYCYEMPSPIFGDVGHGVIGEDGLCYVDIDQIFFETVDMEQSYQIFLQSYAEGNVYVIEKQPQYFIVKGLPNTEFDWELKAKQLDFPIHRLEENFAQDEYKETDYTELASEYLRMYEQEVLSYE